MIDAAEDLTLTFLGERSYLQGTTLFEALIAKAPRASELSFKIAQLFLTDRVEIRAFDRQPERPAPASLTFRDEDQDLRFVQVHPLPPSATIRREPFDENTLLDLAILGDRTIGIAETSPFDTVKTIVSLNKALLGRIMRPPGAGRWLFTRLDLLRYPPTFRRLAVTYRNQIGFAAVTSEIRIDDVAIGRVVFSWRDV